MNNFGKYILQFSRDTDKIQTHLSFNKGKYNVPDNKYDEFYKKYYKAMIEGEELYLIEKVYNSNFRYFLDIDIPKQKSIKLNDNDIKKLINELKNVIEEMYKNDENDVSEYQKYILSKRDNKYHINFYNLVVNSDIAKTLSNLLIDNLENNLKDSVDISVYRTGLRLLGSKKNEKNAKSESNIYCIYDLDTEKYVELKDTTYNDFVKTIIRVKGEETLTQLNDNYKGILKDTKKSNIVNTSIKGIDNTMIKEEIVKLLNELKMTNGCLSDFDTNIERVYAKQNKMGMFCYYVTIYQKYCPFKEREHQRPTNPIYIEISSSGVYVKCYDEDCLRRVYPDGGIKLPDDFSVRYKQLYLSIYTKYWKTEVTISDEVKKMLEESLTGSHYQIAKITYNIYKDRFRVDDVKNTTWFEFDGVRWNRSHLINILISEELPKYYNGIKISDTSVNNNLEEFLSNDEKMNANYRNGLVDNIIKKLENVNFKNNILSQITYLYKTHDPEFYNNLDSNPHLVGFKNGVYDFKQNTFRQSIQSDYITFSTGYDYIDYDENNTQVQEIYEFLSKIITDKKVREYMLKVLGKALVGIPDEKFYIWTGVSGANGKSTLVNFLEYTLGDYTTSVDVSLLTNKRTGSSNASPDVIRLRGKRIFTFQEPEHDDKLRTGILKQFTGGDTIIARELFKAPVTFKLQGTMIMCCNDLPAVSSIDGGTWRRIRVVEFKSRFCDNPVKDNEFKIDPNIKNKIKEWRPYFMSILIHWYNKYLYEGLNEPDEVKKATAKYKVDNDKCNEFFDGCLEECDTFESNKNIYSNFQNWWTSNYPTSKVPDNRELRRALKIKYGTEQEKMINGSMQYGFNVKIKYETSNFDEDDDY